MITSTGNSQVRNVVALKKKPKERKEQDVFLVEGPKMFKEAPKDEIVETYVSSYIDKKFGSSDLLKGRKYEVVAEEVMSAMSDTKNPQGILCIVKQKHYSVADLLKEENPLIMVLENLQDPGNLGTIVRTAEGAGVTGILMTGDCCDIYNPKVIRSTMGSIYRVPFAYTDDLHGVLKDWKNKGIGLYAAHLKGTLSYDQEDYKKPSAFLIGNESKGLTTETADLADHYIRIPMLGKVESLNAAVASCVLMFEAARQRRN